MTNILYIRFLEPTNQWQSLYGNIPAQSHPMFQTVGSDSVGMHIRQIVNTDSIKVCKATQLFFIPNKHQSPVISGAFRIISKRLTYKNWGTSYALLDGLSPMACPPCHFNPIHLKYSSIISSTSGWLSLKTMILTPFGHLVQKSF